MLKEYGEEPERSVSEAPSSKLRGYDFVETPAREVDGRRYRIPETPARDTLAHGMATGSKAQKNALLRTPAVQRLLRAHTPKIGSVFDVPKTPKRKK
jgi:hypothetical protein